MVRKPPHGRGKSKGHMKRLLLAMAAITVIGGTAFYLNRPKAQIAADGLAMVGSSQSAVTDAQPRERGNAGPTPGDSWKKGPASRIQKAVTGTQNDENAMFNQAIDTLISPHAGYQEKQAVWRQLMDSGKLDQALAELERRMAGDPQNAEYPAALGQGYLKKCAQSQDVREQGIYAMKADQVFEAALNLDPSNWDARFTKTIAMSYWPASMNKGQEVIAQFNTLIQQQDGQAPQPQFALPYAWLGDQYQKAGQTENAIQVWQRGAALYPDNAELKTKLATISR